MKKILCLLTLLCCMVPFLALAGGMTFRDEFNTARGGAIHGTVTQANMKVSLVAGAAFVDFSQLGVLTNNVGKYIKVCSVTDPTQCAEGWIKAAGTAETLGDEILTNPSFDADATSWDATNGTIASSHPAGGGQTDDYLIITRVSGDYQYGSQSNVITTGKLLKGQAYIKSGTSGAESGRIKFQEGEPNYTTISATSATSSGSWVQLTVYGTANAAATITLLEKSTATAGTMLFDTATVKQVLTPSYTGVRVVSASGGTDYNWTTNTFTTKTNDSTGFTFTIATSASDIINATAAEPGSGTRTVVDTYGSTELTTNGGFETALTSGTCNDDAGNDNFVGWTETTTNGIVECSVAQAHSGTQSVKLTRTTGSVSLQQYPTVIGSRSYTVSLWSYGDGTYAGRYAIYDATNSQYLQSDGIAWGAGFSTFNVPVTGAWSNTSRTFSMVSTGISVAIYLFSPTTNGGYAYFDDVSVLPTSGLLSIADGKLTFGGGKVTAAWGDPGLWEGAVTRAVGRTIISDVTTPASLLLDGTLVGVDVNQTGSSASNVFYFSNTYLFAWDTTMNSVVYSPSVSTNYKLAMPLRANGAFYLIKDTYWKLLYLSSIDGTATLYPTIVSKNAVSTTSSYLRIPTTLWLPTPIAYDTFTRGNGAIGATETTGPDTGFAPTAKTWASGSTTWTVGVGATANQAINTPVGVELLTNGNMETGDPPTGWSANNATLDGVADERTGGAGSQSIDIQRDAANANANQQVTTSIGTWLMFNLWEKNDTNPLDLLLATDGALSAYTAITSMTNANWVNVIKTYRNPYTNPYVILNSTTNIGQSSRVDDISVKSLTLNQLFATVPTSTADVIATVVPSTNPAGTQAGLVVNVNDTANPTYAIIAYHNGTNCVVEELVNGTWGALPKINTATGCTYGAAYELRMIRDGTTMRLYYNNALIAAAVDTMSANTNTNHGLFSTYSGNTLNDFSLYARGTGGEYNILNALGTPGAGGSLMLLGVGK